MQSLALAGTAATAAAAVPATDRAPRQVIFILGESVRADMLNCYRKTGLQTPSLDRLAEGGMRFTRAYNCQPVCGPARSCIWTGLYPHTNGMWANSMALGDTTHTLGQFLHDNWIDTGLIGKWHLDGSDYFGTGRAPGGWDSDVWYDMRDYLQELSPEDRTRSRDPKTAIEGDWPEDMCFAKRCTDRAVRFLEDRKGKDFFLGLCFDEPHDPSLCPKEYQKPYENFVWPRAENVDDPLTDKPEEQRIWAGPRLHQLQPPVKSPLFFGSHTMVDRQIGRVLDQIEKSCPNALVIFTSDHGVFLESHRLTDKGPAMYDEITNIPFLVRWPGHTPAGTVSSRLMSHVDIVGTVMDYFGLAVPATSEGSSMLHAFKDPKAPTREHVFIEWGRYEVDHDGFGGYQPIRCVFDGRYKLSINLNSGDELYDLKNDPGEMRNLIDSAEHAATRNKLHDVLLNQMNESRDPFRGYYWGHRPWRPEYKETWPDTAMTRQRKCDGYMPLELDYDTGLPMKAATRPKQGPL